MPKAGRWEVRSERPGTFDLWHDRRLVKIDLEDIELALAEAKRRGATEVDVIESDGYPMRTRV